MHLDRPSSRGLVRTMIDEPETVAQPPAGPPDAEVVAAPVRPTILRSVWTAAKVGVRLISYVALPIGFLAVVWGLAFTAFGLGARRGFRLYGWQFAGAGFYLSCALWGGIVGAAIGLVIALFSR